MKQFKEFRQEQLNESIIADLAILTKDLSKITYNVGVITTKALGKGAMKGIKALKNRYSKQAIADRKASKALKQANKLEKLRVAKVQYLKQKERIEREQKAIKGIDAKTKAQNKAELDKTLKKLSSASKMVNKNLGKLEKQGV